MKNKRKFTANRLSFAIEFKNITPTNSISSAVKKKITKTVNFYCFT